MVEDEAAVATVVFPVKGCECVPAAETDIRVDPFGCYCRVGHCICRQCKVFWREHEACIGEGQSNVSAASTGVEEGNDQTFFLKGFVDCADI